MKTVLRKGSLSTGASSGAYGAVRSGAPAKPAAKPANPYKLTPTASKSNSTVWIAVGGGAVVLIGIILMYAAYNREEPQQVVQQQAVSEPVKPNEPIREAALGGKTMAEWSKEHEKNSALAQSRKNARKSPQRR